MLDALLAAGIDGPVGYRGVSLGTMTGVPLAAVEPRITAAVFGLAGGQVLERAASREPHYDFRWSSCCNGTTSWHLWVAA